MPMNSYQYGTSPRKYEPDYTEVKVKKVKIEKKLEKKKVNPKAKQGKNRALQVVIVLAIFGMLLTVSYREISIMEMFNQKKDLENNLAVVQKENGQVEKSIKEVESTLDWNSIQQKATEALGMLQKATEALGMQKKAGVPIELNKSDNVETTSKLIKEEKVSLVDKVIEYFINK